MRIAWLPFLVCGCGGGSNGPDLVMTTTFPVTTALGANPSPLDPLIGNSIAIRIEWPAVDYNHGDGSDPAGCKTTALIGASLRTASGPTMTTVTQELLEPLEDWDVVLQLCTAGNGGSSISVDAVIDRLNLGITCFGLPPSASATDADGYPEVTSFTATMCGATILDVVNNRSLGADGYSMTFATGPDRVP